VLAIGPRAGDILAILDGPDGIAIVTNVPIDPASASAAVIVKKQGEEVAGTVELLSGPVALWTPKNPALWIEGASYEVTVGAGMVDIAGRAIVAPIEALAFIHLAQGDAIWTRPIEAPLRQQSAYGNDRFLHGRLFLADLNLSDHRARFYDPETQTFLSPDDLGPVDSPSLYQAFSLDPTSITDPTGRYEADVHLGLTYYLALKAGFSREEALKIAKANQLTDDDPRFSSTANAALGNWTPVYEYHFPVDPSEGRVVSGSSVAWKKAHEARTFGSLGRALHVLQDSYGHRNAWPGNLSAQVQELGLLGAVGLTYAQSAGRVSNPSHGITHEVRAEWIDRFKLPRAVYATDWTFVEPTTALEAARATFSALMGFRRQIGLNPGPFSPGARNEVLEWGTINEAVWQFCRVDTVSEKIAWLQLHSPEAIAFVRWSSLSLAGL